MSRRSILVSCALGAALADLAWLAATGLAETFDSSPPDSRYELEAKERYEVIACFDKRSVGCGHEWSPSPATPRSSG